MKKIMNTLCETLKFAQPAQSIDTTHDGLSNDASCDYCSSNAARPTVTDVGQCATACYESDASWDYAGRIQESPVAVAAAGTESPRVVFDGPRSDSADASCDYAPLFSVSLAS